MNGSTNAPVMVALHFPSLLTHIDGPVWVDYSLTDDELGSRFTAEVIEPWNAALDRIVAEAPAPEDNIFNPDAPNEYYVPEPPDVSIFYGWSVRSIGKTIDGHPVFAQRPGYPGNEAAPVEIDDLDIVSHEELKTASIEAARQLAQPQPVWTPPEPRTDVESEDDDPTTPSPEAPVQILHFGDGSLFGLFRVPDGVSEDAFRELAGVIGSELATIAFEHGKPMSSYAPPEGDFQGGEDYIVIEASSSDGDIEALLASLEALGLQRGAFAANLVSGWLPIAALFELGSIENLGQIRDPHLYNIRQPIDGPYTLSPSDLVAIDPAAKWPIDEKLIHQIYDPAVVENYLVGFQVGTSGDDILHGHAGGDMLQGFGGDDTYAVDNALDQIIEAEGNGHDVVYASINYILEDTQSIETAILTGDATYLRGNDAANQLFGNDQNNVLEGKGGTDYLLGLGGDDIFQVSLEANANDLDVFGDFEGAGVVGGDRIALDASIWGMDGIVSQVSQTSFIVSRADGSNAQQFIIANLAAGNSGLLEGDDYYFG